MEALEKLNETLLEQNFIEAKDEFTILEEAKTIAKKYAKVEHSIAVLSDLKTNKSYIYRGLVAQALGLENTQTEEEIDSIWEEGIFSRIHPDHLSKKYQFEIQFFQFLKGVPIEKRSHYYVVQNISILNQSDVYTNILFRMFYISSQTNGSVRHALCLYNFPPMLHQNSEFEGVIMNAATGETVVLDDENSKNILTWREKEVLTLIDRGYSSKIIANDLNISIHTVSRHRQNILEKLRAINSLEACRLAKSIGLI